MNKKVAILFAANIYNKKGLFNAAHNRIKHLKEIASYDVDAFIVSSYIPDWLIKIKGGTVQERPSSTIIDGVNYKILWYRNSLIDYFLYHYLHIGAYFKKGIFKKIASSLKGYNLIEAHSGTNDIAVFNNEIYGTPYCLTWHGSDIHTEPFKNESVKKNTAYQIKHAAYNFFVSKKLMETSELIAFTKNKCVLYNGADKRFRRLSDAERIALRNKLNANNRKIVGFVGNLIPIKNIMALPAIFKDVYGQQKNVEFWIIGNGPLQKSLAAQTTDIPMRFWGNQEPSKIPELMNCIDVLVLPSLNEGLPLVTVEALNCGCNVVGSNVGGIPESIGKDSCVDLSDSKFTQKFADKVLQYLENPVEKQHTLEQFDWMKTANIENGVIKNILEKNV